MQSTTAIRASTSPIALLTEAKLDVHAPQALAVLRIVTAVLFVQAGVQILFNFPTQTMPIPPELQTLVTIAGVLELVGGAFLFVGLLTRPIAFVLSGQMAVGYWVVHAPMSPFPTQNMGAAAILFCFIYLYLMFAGPGAWSLDNRRRS